MTVTSEVSRSGPYNGNGATTVFPYEFKIFTAGDLLVTEVDLDGVETTLIEGTDYTVDGVLSDDGGDVTLTTALAGDGTDAGSHKLTIRRVLDATQTMNLRSQGKISAEVLERAHDRAVMLIQQLLDERDRSLRLIESEAGSELLTLLPPLADRKGRQLTFDPTTGQPTASSPTSATISAAMQPVVASATLALARAAMGPWSDASVISTSSTTARDLASRFAEVIYAKDYGVLADGSTNDTTAMRAAVTAAANKSLVLPAGTIVTDDLTLSSPTNIITAGLATKLKRTTTSLFDKPQITISSDSVTIGDLSFEGNIATDTGEFNHCVAIQKTTAGSMQGIRLGVLKALNIRGDVLYVGGTPTAKASDIVCAGVIFANCLRSGVSVCGGEGVLIGFIDGYQCGYRVFDVEPNPAGANQTCDGIEVGWIRGGRLQFAGDSGNAIRYVHIGRANLDASLQTNSSPAYASYDSTAPIVQGQNIVRVVIDDLTVANCSFVPCFFGAGSVKGVLEVGRYISTGTGTSETTYKTQFVCDGLSELWLGAAQIDSFDAERAIAKGTATTRYRMGYLGKVVNDGIGVAYGDYSTFENVELACAANVAWQYVTNSKFVGCVVSASSHIFNAMTRNQFELCEFTYSTLLDYGSSTKIQFVNSKVNTVFYADWRVDSGYVSAVRIGSNWLWVDPASGKVYTKASQPTTNTDGTVVGTQT